MRHCVISYAQKMAAGKCSIYKILSPERATLEIDTRGDTPKIEQIKLYRNGRPASRTLEAVEKWFTMNLENSPEIYRNNAAKVAEAVDTIT